MDVVARVQEVRIRHQSHVLPLQDRGCRAHKEEACIVVVVALVLGMCLAGFGPGQSFFDFLRTRAVPRRFQLLRRVDGKTRFGDHNGDFDMRSQAFVD